MQARVLLALAVVALLISPVVASGWQLIWSDEFNGSSLDTTKWRVETGPSGRNNELHYRSTDEVYLQNGSLVIRSRKRSMGGMAYTSGEVTTRSKWPGARFGKWEGRAKVPYGNGLWPAMWMLPYSGYCWPSGGEIDIMEILGQDTKKLYTTYHYNSVCGTSIHDGVTTTTTSGLHLDYHVYGIEWNATHLQWFLDGKLVHTLVEGAHGLHLPPSNMVWILNTAIGGNWPVPPDATTVWPQYYLIDWVRVYQWSSTATTPAPTTTKPPTPAPTTTKPATPAPTTTKPAPTPLPGYVGCYRDQANPRALVGLTPASSYVNSTTMTIPKCQQFCGLRGYTYSGVQYGIECWCGQTLSGGAIANESSCNIPCAGATTTICGGNYRNSIYKSAPGYKGCFIDSKTTRDLPVKVGSLANMTLCKNYAYAGVQYSKECWCGNAFGEYGKAPFAQCNMTCAGTGTEMCGGSLRNSIYAVGAGFVRAEASGSSHHAFPVWGVAVVVVAGVLAAVALVVVLIVVVRKRSARSAALAPTQEKLLGS